MKNSKTIKNIVHAVIFITAATIHSSNAQDPVLWGMTSAGGQGGSNGFGNIFSINASGSGFTEKRGFILDYPGQRPYGDLIQASNGKLYGMTYQGGNLSYQWGYGILFEYDPVTSVSTKKIEFNEVDGASPLGSLMQASNGKIYGMTTGGGIYHKGVLFEYDATANVFTKKLDFNGANGASPYGSLIQASNGKLYGMTFGGGDSSAGILFEFDPATSVYTKKFDFSNINGKYPRANLTQASNGKLYGMTSWGGSGNSGNGYGVLFEYDPSTNVYTKKLDFNGTNGANPYGSLIEASNGFLYGMTQGGSNNNGILFKYNPATNVYTKKINFGVNTNGTNPYGSLIQASNGKLYGMTNQGGITYQISNNGYGVLFEYDPVTNIYTKKLDFLGANGKNPLGSLIQASNGKLYGMTTQGGINYDNGLLFEYNLGTNIYTKKFDFNTIPNGAHPYGSLMRASNGNLYGMTSAEGDSSGGILFEYNPMINSYTKKHDFTGANGKNPYGSLMQASNGKLYGMTSNGGNGFYGEGVLFEYDALTNIYVKKLVFNSTNGARPYGSLIQASNGKLYGMTSDGGRGWGAIFQYDPYTNVIRIKHNFRYPTGATPNGSLIQASNGKLYGMTTDGGINQGGVLFEYDPIAKVYTKKIDFDIANGIAPYGSLIQASNGKLYGMTIAGGDSSVGVLFEYDPTTNIYTKKFDFDWTNGAGPQGSLMQASNSKLYGMTRSGGINNAGVLFEYDPVTNVYTKKFDFNLPTMGGNPQFTNLIELAISIPATAINATSTSICKNSSTTLSVQGGFLGAGASWHWYSDSCGGTPIGTGDSITVSPTQGTTYYVRAEGNTTTTGCTQITITVKAVPAHPIITVNGPTIFCTGTIPLTLTASSSASYQWLKGGNIIPGATNKNYNPVSGGTHKVRITNNSGCSSTSIAGVHVTINPVPAAIITPSGPLTFCSGDSVNLQANSGAGFTYQWKKGNTLITGATSQSYIAKTAGTYKVIVTNANICSMASSGKKVIINCRSNEISTTDDNELELELAPNPVNDKLTLNIDAINDGKASMCIYNITGENQLCMSADVTDGNYQNTIDVSSYPGGMYMLIIVKDNNRVARRFVKK